MIKTITISVDIDSKTGAVMTATMTGKNEKYYQPFEMATLGEDTSIDEIAEKVDLYPELFVVFDAWTVDDLIKGAMYVEDLHTNYFESEV